MVDATGSVIRLFGIDVTGLGKGIGLPDKQGVAATGCPGWQAPDQATLSDVVKFGFNVIRLPITWANLEPNPPSRGADGRPVHTYDQTYLAAVDSAVHAFTSRGIAVIIEMAQSHWSPAFTDIPQANSTIKCQGVGMPIWLYPHPTIETEIQARQDFFSNVADVQQGYVDVWKLIAQRYASNPMVIAGDMMNEPYTKGHIAPADLRLNALYQKLGSAIRSVDPHLVLIFQDSKADPNGDFGLRSAPEFANEIYSFHLYVDNWNPEGLELAQSYLDRASSWNVPLLIGEFDAFGYASPYGAPATWRQSLQEMMAWCSAHSVSWSLFTYADRWVLQPGTDQPRPDLLPTLAAGW
jgi:hypothetical protein